MNKRIRKKKHLGEFKELGFELSARMRPELTYGDLNELMDRLITVVESRHLEFGGGTTLGELRGFVTRAEGGSTTEEDRAALQAFFKGDADVTECEVGELRDAWYNWND